MICLFLGGILMAQSSEPAYYSFHAHLGGVYNFNTPITFTQQGEEDIRFIGKYRAEPFILPVYWDYQLQRVQHNKAWGIRTTHHKIILDNPSEEINRFEITHGFNMVNVFHARELRGFILQGGAGITLAHPESNVRGHEYVPANGILGTEYMITGPNIEVSLGRRFYFTKRLYGHLESRFTFSRINVPIFNGRAKSFNIALHGLFGLGFDFGPK